MPLAQGLLGPKGDVMVHELFWFLLVIGGVFFILTAIPGLCETDVTLKRLRYRLKKENSISDTLN